jgi:hypothetical protein
MRKKKDYIIVYYYSMKERSWIADVVDEDNKVIRTVRAINKEHIKQQAKVLRELYGALRISKTPIK